MTNNCPNCGAPISGPVCEYCGTRHARTYSEANLYTDDKLYMSLQIPFNSFQREYANIQTQIAQAEQTQYLLSTLNSFGLFSANDIRTMRGF